MQRRREIIMALLLVVLGSLLLITVLPNALQPPDRVRGEAIALVTIDGTFSDSGGGLLGTGVTARQLQAELRRAREDAGVRAVLVRINSAGGSAAAAQEVARELQRLREAGKPVVVSLGDVAASGAYWSAAYADEIVASPATLTGSIGAVYQSVHMVGLYEMLGIEVETITSGPFKDTGGPHRELRDDERALIQQMVDDLYDQFVDAVVEGRGLEREAVLELADGRIFTGRQAQEVGLVDRFGNLNEAAERTAELAGLERYRLVPMSEPGLLDRLLGPVVQAVVESLRDGLGLAPEFGGGVLP